MSCRTLLRVMNLKTYFYTPGGVVKAVDGVSFELEACKTLGIVGESGCGKSTVALSILQLIDRPGKIVSGEIYLNGQNLLCLSEEQIREIRGKEISMIFQDPMASLNPVLTVGRQVTEVISCHQRVSKKEAKRRAIEVLERAGISYAKKIITQYPFQLSGGMRQRVMIAIALALNPKVLIADEPTTALDVTIQAQILSEMKSLKKRFDSVIILITHDLGVVAELADKVAVMYAGTIVEHSDVKTIFEKPIHPYTAALLKSTPCLSRENEILEPIKGSPPDLLNLPDQCAYLPRCGRTIEACFKGKPALQKISANHLVACYNPSISAPKGKEVLSNELT